MSAGDFATSRRSIEGDGRTIRELAARGLGVQTISKMVGLSTIDVRNALTLPKRETPPLPPERPGTAWTRERTAKLVEVYWTQDQTAEKTADILGCTREAVVGKANRLGLKKNRPRAVRTADFGSVHSAANPSPEHGASKQYTGDEGAYL